MAQRSVPQAAGVWTTRVVGATVAAAVVVLGTAGVVAAFFTQRQTLVTDLDGAVTSVRVATDVGDVNIVPAADGRIRVERRLTWSFTKPGGDVVVRDGTVDVSGTCPGATLGECGVDVVLRVPPGTRVQVDSTSGDLAAREVEAPLDLQTTSGDVTGEALRSKDVRVQSTAGDVRLSFDAPPDSVQAQATTGDVTVQLPVDAVSYRVEKRTSLGEARVDVPEDPRSTHVVSVQTSFGDVVVTPL